MKLSNNPIVATPSEPKSAEAWALEDLDQPKVVAPGEAGPSAEDERRDLERRAYERGYRAGVADGAQREAERVKPALEAVSTVVEVIESDKPAWLRDAKNSLYALALAIARQIVDGELSADTDTVRTLVARAVAQFPIDEPLTIRLNPLDLSVISAESLEDQSMDALAAGREVRWRPDPMIEQGGCVVEGPERLVDGRVDKALLRIYHELVGND